MGTNKHKIGHLTYWENQCGCIEMSGTKTLKRYHEIKYGGKYKLPYDAGIKEILAFSDMLNNMVRKECDPQEVYFYEYNNHECQFHFDGDYDAYRFVTKIFGEETASKIKRV